MIIRALLTLMGISVIIYGVLELIKKMKWQDYKNMILSSVIFLLSFIVLGSIVILF